MPAVTLEGPLGKQGVYRVRWRYGGRRPRKSLGPIATRDAERRRDEIEETLRLIEAGRLTVPAGVDATEFIFTGGRIEQVRQALQHTVQAATDEYLNSRRGRICDGTYKEYEIRLRTVRNAIGAERTIDSITIRDLELFASERQQSVSGDTTKRDLIRFLDAYKLAAAKGWISKPLNPDSVMMIITPTLLRKKKKPDWRTYGETLREIERRQLSEEASGELWSRTYLDNGELRRFLDDLAIAATDAPGFVYPMIVTAAFTGGRRSELCRLNTHDVDLAGGVITLRQRKAHNKQFSESERIVPIHGRLAPVLESWLSQHAGGEALFYTPGDLARSSRKIDGPRPTTSHMATDHLLRVVGKMKDWKHVAGRWHLFRHSFISWCAVAGVPEADIESWVGHLTPEMRKHYTHLSIDRKRSQMERLECPAEGSVT